MAAIRGPTDLRGVIQKARFGSISLKNAFALRVR
jgi:hypothetical protein